MEKKRKVEITTQEGEVSEKEVIFLPISQTGKVSGIDIGPGEVRYSIKPSGEEKQSSKIRVTRNRIRNLFPFLSEEYESNPGTSDEIKAVKEKCEAHPSQVQCEECYAHPRGICWNLILAKVLNVLPHVHGGYEVADTTVFKYDEQTFFVIKHCKIAKPAGKEGNILFRQCLSLFRNENVHVIYLNALPTHQSLLEDIIDQASYNKYSPRFSILRPIDIEQIFACYQNTRKKTTG